MGVNGLAAVVVSWRWWVGRGLRCSSAVALRSSGRGQAHVEEQDGHDGDAGHHGVLPAVDEGPPGGAYQCLGIGPAMVAASTALATPAGRCCLLRHLFRYGPVDEVYLAGLVNRFLTAASALVSTPP